MHAALRLHDAAPATLPLLHAGLTRLAADLGDPCPIDAATLHGALFGPQPSCHGVLALGPDEALLGAALYSPVLSTSTGGAGAYVSDLWVAPPARGQALGPRLLAHVATRADALWQARFLRLVSYTDNNRAHGFYNRLGFATRPSDRVLQLSGDAFDQLMGET